METYPVGYRVVSKHTGLEYEILRAFEDKGLYTHYIGRRDDGEETPLIHHGIVPSTLQSKETWAKEEPKKVTLQPLGDGLYRVNGMNRSAVTGKFETFKYQVDQKVGDYTISGRRSNYVGEHTYRLRDKEGAMLPDWFTEQNVADLSGKSTVTYKYEVGEIWTSATGGQRVEERRVREGKKEYLLSWWFFDGSISQPEWRDEDLLDSMNRGFKNVGWKGLAEYMNDTSRPATSIGVTTKIKVEGKVWMVQNVALERNNELVAFGCALVSEGIDGAWDYKTHKVYTDAMVEVVP